jgi:hypothetical protein
MATRIGVKTVRTVQELAEHLGKFPEGVRVLIQRYGGPGEAGIIPARAVRVPWCILSSRSRLLRSDEDSTSTLRELILMIIAPARWRSLFKAQPQESRSRDPIRGATASFRRNHVRGAVFEDGSNITPALSKCLIQLREKYRVLCQPFRRAVYQPRDEARRRIHDRRVQWGRRGPTHIWDPRTSIIETYAGLLTWKYLYVLGAANRARGARPMLRPIVRRYFD